MNSPAAPVASAFRWHPAARLIDAQGAAQRPVPAAGTAISERSAARAVALTLAVGAGAVFRIGGGATAPVPGAVPMLETLTSGSSGRPRHIRRTQGSWIASFAVNAALFGIGPGARVAVLGGMDQSLALYGALEGLHLGAEVHLLHGLRPDRAGAALAARGVQTLYATPAQLRQLVDAAAPCPALRRIIVGGSKLDPALAQALRAWAGAADVREFYGAAEASFITLTDADTPEGSVGRAYPGVEIRIDGPGVGQIWLRSPYVFDSYAGDDPGGAVWRDGWLSVGEMGRLEAGYVYLSGRAGRMVTVADHNVFPEEIEAWLAGLPGVRQAAVLPRPDTRRGVVLVAVLQGDPAQEAAILAAGRATLGPLKAPRALIWRQDWPLLPSGKTDLGALARGLEGALARGLE